MIWLTEERSSKTGTVYIVISKTVFSNWDISIKYCLQTVLKYLYIIETRLHYILDVYALKPIENALKILRIVPLRKKTFLNYVS